MPDSGSSGRMTAMESRDTTVLVPRCLETVFPLSWSSELRFLPRNAVLAYMQYMH